MASSITTTVEEIVDFIQAVVAEVPSAIAAFQNVESVVAGGGIVTQAQWNQAIADITAANAAVQAAESPGTAA